MLKSRKEEEVKKIEHYRYLVDKFNNVDTIGQKSVYQYLLIRHLEKYIEMLEEEIDFYKATRWL